MQGSRQGITSWARLRAGLRKPAILLGLLVGLLAVGVIAHGAVGILALPSDSHLEATATSPSVAAVKNLTSREGMREEAAEASPESEYASLDLGHPPDFIGLPRVPPSTPVSPEKTEPQGASADPAALPRQDSTLSLQYRGPEPRLEMTIPEAGESSSAEKDDSALAATPAWRRNAVQLASQPHGPAIALVIDDVGLNHPGTERSIALPGPLTLSLMTYAEDLPSLAEKARAAGHELIVHIPMQPIAGGLNAGDKVLSVELGREELLERLAWGLDRFEGYVGINNHMGSRFTADPEGMATVMAELKRRGLMFLDSKTVSNSVGVPAARGAGVPAVARDIFIDHELEPAYIAAQLRALEDLARERGYAIGIGHPHAMTLEALERWIPEARARGITFVPISAVPGLQERSLAAHRADSSG